MGVYPPSDEANIRDLLKGPAKQQIKNDTDRERALIKATARMLTEIRLARKSPAAFIEFAFRTPTLGRIKLADFHKFWLERFDNAYRVQIEASKNHGKCCIGSERILLADGTLVTAEELAATKTANILTYDPVSDHYHEAAAFIDFNGVQSVATLELSTGSSITRTLNEPLLTPNGFKPLEEIQVGDYVACAKDLGTIGIPAENIHDVLFAGFMLACGTCTSSPRYSKQDPGVLAACATSASALGFTFVRVKPNKHDYYIRAGYGKVPAWLRKQGLYNKTALHKRVPSHIFCLDRYAIGRFVTAYWDGDGSYSERAQQIQFDSKSKNLLLDIQALLLRLGIVAQLSKKTSTYNKAPYISWRLSLTGGQAYKFINDWLRLYSSRSNNKPSLSLCADCTNEAASRIPITDLIRKAQCDTKLKRVLRKLNMLNSKTVGCARLQALIEALAQAGLADEIVSLAKLRSDKIWWSVVTAKSLVHTAPTYSIYVPANPVYIGEHVISHNTTNVIGYLAWKIGKNPGIRAKLFTQSAAKARQRLQVISTVVQHNKYYHLVFPDVRRDKDGPWHKTGIQVVRDNQDEKEPTLEAMGIMGSVEGGRADLVLFDDISDYRNSLLYPQIRDSLKNKVFAEILPMLDVGGRAISIATPHHQLDIIAALRHNKQWESYQFPVGKGDDPFHPLWPDVITREILQAKCEEVGLTEYNRAYRLKEIQLGQQMIKPNFIKYYTAQDLGNPYHHICVQAYDLAATTNKSSSYFTGCTLLYDKRRDLVFVADAWRDKIEIMDQASVVIRDYMKWDASLVLLEETGYQGALRKIILERLTHMDGSSPAQGLQHVLRGISPGSKSKELRLMETLPMFETNKILFNPRLDPTIGIELSLRGDLISQLVNFAGEKDKDMADAFAHAIKGVQSFRRETDQEENEDEWDSGDGMETRLLLV